MNRLRSLIVVGCLVASSAPAVAHAFAIEAGYSSWDNNIGDGANLQLYPQWNVGYGLTPELQIGVHWAKHSETLAGTINFLHIPVMAGLRWDLGKVLPLGILGPFVGGHLGYTRFEEFNSNGSDGTNNFAFNFVAGLNFELGDAVALGVQGGADFIVPNGDGAQEHIYSIGAILTL